MSKKLIELKMPKCDHSARDSRYGQLNYTHSAPFFENPRGILIHRVRALYRLSFGDRDWWIIDYWCENTAHSKAVDPGLVFDPGKKLICTRCEANAIAHEEKSSSELAGRHVCTGSIRVVNNCCPQTQN